MSLAKPYKNEGEFNIPTQKLKKFITTRCFLMLISKKC